MKFKPPGVFRRLLVSLGVLALLVAWLLIPVTQESGTTLENQRSISKSDEQKSAGTSENQRINNKSDEQKSAGKIIESVGAAWNKNDMDSIAKLFLPDAVLITPTGSVIRSRSAIRERLIDERNGKLKDTTLRNTIEGVSLPNSNTAVVKGQYQINGMKILGIETSPEGPFTLHQKKQQGRWMIAKAEILRKQSN